MELTPLQVICRRRYDEKEGFVLYRHLRELSLSIKYVVQINFLRWGGDRLLLSLQGSDSSSTRSREAKSLLATSRGVRQTPARRGGAVSPHERCCRLDDGQPTISRHQNKYTCLSPSFCRFCNCCVVDILSICILLTKKNERSLTSGTVESTTGRRQLKASCSHGKLTGSRGGCARARVLSLGSGM